MARTICYEEICNANDTIHVRSLLLATAIVATVIAAAWILNGVLTEAEFLNIPLLSLDF